MVFRIFYLQQYFFAMFENLLQQNSSQSQDEEMQLEKVPVRHYNKQAKQLSLQKQNLELSELKEISSPSWNFLHSLIICTSNVGVNGIRLLTSTTWPQLRQLHLSQNQFGDQGVKILCKAEWPNLELLNIGSNFIRNEGIRILTTGNWKKIKQLSIYYNQQNILGVFYITKLNCTNLSVVYGWMGYLQDNLEDDMKNALENFKICL